MADKKQTKQALIFPQAEPVEAMTSVTPTTTVTRLPGVGVDIGTANIAVSRFISKLTVHPDGGTSLIPDITFKANRDCFLTFPESDAALLDGSGVEYHVSEDEKSLLVIGKAAVPFAQAMGIPLRRPLAKGFISDKEDLSKEVVKLLLSSLLGAPTVPGELAVFSIPGAPVDGDIPKANYHTRFFSDRLKELGYNPVPLNEAMAVCLTELRDVQGAAYTGLTFSFGAGMVNVALVFKGILIRAFSLSMGGDFIDEGAAKATSTPLSHVTSLKEDGIYLVNTFLPDPSDETGESKIKVTAGTIVNRQEGYHDNQSDRQAEAVVMMYRELLTKLRDVLENFLADPANRVDIKDPIPVIVSGGTAQAPGFAALFNDIVLKDLQTRLRISDSAQLAADPMSAVAHGAARRARMKLNSSEGE